MYDVSIPAAGVWVRGTISHNARGGVMEVIVPLAWSLLPALIVVSALGGFLIAWLSFRPMEKVISTAEAISDGGDLSRRIGLPKGRSEISLSGRRLRRYVRPAWSGSFEGGASIHLRTPFS